MGRRFFVGGNWKLNGSNAFVDKLVGELNAAQIPSEDKVEVVVAPSFLYLERTAKAIRKEVKVSAQNSYSEASGAYTGEVSPEMLKDIGIEWVILGHSERRDIFHESSEVVAKKVAHAIKAGLKVILCCGEHLEERESGKTEQVVFDQLTAVAKTINNWDNIVIAYEPVWAIGTGRTATPEIAQETHAAIRKFLREKISPEVAENTRILYGGSVKAANAKELAAQKDVDGFLVGGASLIGNEFIAIINSVSAKL